MSSVETVELLQLSLERAESIVPADYLPAWQWFIDHENTILDKLPWDEQLPVRLVAQRGIHKPGKQPYALAIKSMGNDFYMDNVIDQDDGTWVFSYCKQRKNIGSKETTDIYNESLRRCMREGIPVGVYIKQPGSGARYECKGLAFVEEYDSATGMFKLHGPVRHGQSIDFWSIISESEMTEEDRQIAEEFSDDDERKIKLAKRVERQSQGKFRAELLRAYDGHCAISECGVTPVLQAAHISSYRGPKSQVVTNGLLLRADLHLLYDEKLFSVEPATYKIAVSPKIFDSMYGEMLRSKERIDVPRRVADRPSDQRLAAHFADFQFKNAG